MEIDDLDFTSDEDSDDEYLSERLEGYFNQGVMSERSYMDFINYFKSQSNNKLPIETILHKIFFFKNFFVDLPKEIGIQANRIRLIAFLIWRQQANQDTILFTDKEEKNLIGLFSLLERLQRFCRKDYDDFFDYLVSSFVKDVPWSLYQIYLVLDRVPPKELKSVINTNRQHKKFIQSQFNNDKSDLVHYETQLPFPDKSPFDIIKSKDINPVPLNPDAAGTLEERLQKIENRREILPDHLKLSNSVTTQKPIPIIKTSIPSLNVPEGSNQPQLSPQLPRSPRRVRRIPSDKDNVKGGSPAPAASPASSQLDPQRIMAVLKVTSPLRGGLSPVLSRTSNFKTEDLENPIKSAQKTDKKRKRGVSQTQLQDVTKKLKFGNVAFTESSSKKGRSIWVLPENFREN